MSKIDLHPIEGPTLPEPWQTDALAMIVGGGGDVEYSCGTCGYVVAANFSPGQFSGTGTIECRACGSTLAMPDHPAAARST